MQKNIIKNLKKYFEDRNEVRLAYLFGSVLTGQMHEESDVDIAVLFAEKPDLRNLSEIINDLEEILHQKVDLGVLNDSSPIFRMQVITKGKLIYMGNSKTQYLFVIKTVNEYDDLKYYRNIQEKNLMKGRIFA
jgi:predicted nucleotidyltransferase